MTILPAPELGREKETERERERVRERGKYREKGKERDLNNWQARGGNSRERTSFTSEKLKGRSATWCICKPSPSTITLAISSRWSLPPH